jgi:hypothetical protein
MMNLTRLIRSLNFYAILKWNLKKMFREVFHQFYINIPILILKKVNVIRSTLNYGTDIYVIAYNNYDTLLLQYEKLTMYLEDEFNYIIIDNSSKKEVRKKIYEFCNEKHLGYISLPYQKIFKVSDSHALALNWTFQNLIKIRRPFIVGLIDHDIFPFRNYNIIKSLKNYPFYGVRHFAVSSKNKNVWSENTPEFWYLWPGFVFFNYALIQNIRFDFMPMHRKDLFFDTGGCLYKSYYCKLTQTNTSFFVQHNWLRISHERGVDLFDDSWVHVSNVSNWRKINERLDYPSLSEIVNKFENNLINR